MDSQYVNARDFYEKFYLKTFRHVTNKLIDDNSSELYTFYEHTFFNPMKTYLQDKCVDDKLPLANIFLAVGKIPPAKYDARESLFAYSAYVDKRWSDVQMVSLVLDGDLEVFTALFDVRYVKEFPGVRSVLQGTIPNGTDVRDVLNKPWVPMCDENKDIFKIHTLFSNLKRATYPVEYYDRKKDKMVTKDCAVTDIGTITPNFDFYAAYNALPTAVQQCCGHNMYKVLNAICEVLKRRGESPDLSIYAASQVLPATESEIQEVSALL